MTYALRSFEYWAYSYRRVWRGSVVTSIVGPILYLTALGIGLGKLVNRGPGVGVPYLDFVAPGILAATAMQLATFESSYPVMAAIRWTRQYHAMLATPLRVRDVAIAHQVFIASRMFTTALVYFIVIAAFGAVSSPLGVLAIPVAVLVGLSYSTFIAAWAARTDNEASFVAIFRFGILPMFLFSGTFFPIDRLPRVLEFLAYLTPLWHGVDLCRMLVLDDVVAWLALVHVLYLLAFVGAGLALALLSYRRRLVV
jgi:lipooligosaccharide transport system permease protein